MALVLACIIIFGSYFVLQEHVIVQLQEETNTVGEYITIYQYQRQQQRKRLEENERQLQIVSRDREDLKTKLSQLQQLVTSFVHEAPPPRAGKPDQLPQRPQPEVISPEHHDYPVANGPTSNHNGTNHEIPNGSARFP